MKIENRTVFIANDGKVFNSSCECMDYERRIAEERWKKVPKIKLLLTLHACSYEDHYVVICRNVDDVEAVNEYMHLFIQDEYYPTQYLKLDDIEKRVCLAFQCDGEGCWNLGYAEELIKEAAIRMLMDEPQIGVE